MNSTIEWGEANRITNGPATVERVLDRTDGGMVAECRLSVDADQPVAVGVRDEFPAELAVDEVHVTGASDLANCEATPDGVSFEAVVPPGDVVEVSYTIDLAEEATEPYGPPAIVRAVPMQGTTDEAELRPLREDGVTVSTTANGENGAGAAPVAVPPSATVAALVEAFRSDDVSEEQLGVLRDRLGDQTSSSTDVRLGHVESQLARIEAYSDALEAFIEENGTAREVFEELRADLSTHQSELATLRETQQAAETDRGELRSEMADVRSEVETLRAETDELREEVSELRSLMESLSSVFAGDSDPSDLPGQ